MSKRDIHKFINSFGFRAFKLTLAVLFLVLLTLYIGRASTAFTGFPKGYDSLGHLSLIKIIKENFPYVFWNPYWDNGTVLLWRSYPPLFHFSLGLLARLTGLAIPFLVQGLLLISLCLTIVFIFLTVWLITKKVLPGLFSALVFLASSTIWYGVVVGGLYPRVLGMMMMSLVVFSLILDRTYRSSKTYWLLVLALILALLSHLLTGLLTLIALGVMLFFLEGNLRRALKKFWQRVWPALGLTAFYYLPVLVCRPGKVMFFNPSTWTETEYGPLAFLSLFKQGYPGLPFLSLPLGVFVLLLVFVLKYKLEKEQRRVLRIFFAFGLLTMLCLLYVLGFYKFSVYGLKPEQVLAQTAFFLAIFLGLGIYFLDSLKILRRGLFWILLIGLVGLALNQAPKLEQLVIQNEWVYRRIAPQKYDEEKEYRFSHQYDIIGGGFNYYSQGLQTGGYYEQGILFPEYHWWYQTTVFGGGDNLEETKFLLDWYGVQYFSLHSQGSGVRASWSKFTKGDEFAQVGGREYQYQKAQPILLATKAPVIVLRGKKKYDELWIDLTKKGIGSQGLVPILSRWARAEDFSTQVVEETEIAPNHAEFGVKGPFDSAQGEPIDSIQAKGEFVNSHKRVIELEEYFPGVLLKESYNRNWVAWLEEDPPSPRLRRARQNLKIYFAGPGMMYVSLPKEYDLPARVVFEYQMGWIERLGIGITVLTVIGLGFVTSKSK